jgi:uncharacterized membrane protein YtjA (UPF0391 family)
MALADCHRAPESIPRKRRAPMLRWALAFFVIALIAAVFGYVGIATTAVSIARVLFFVFLVLFVVSLVRGLLRSA